MHQRTASRIFKAARAMRRKLTANETGAYLIDMKQRAGPVKATHEWRTTVIEWLATCKFIRVSPLQKDTLLVRGDDGKKNVRVPRLFCEVGLTTLFNMAKDELEIPFGERTFRNIMPLNLRRLTHRRESCGCPRHLKMHKLHSALVRHRANEAKRLGNRHKPSYNHANPSMAAAEGACGEVTGDDGKAIGFTPGGGPPITLRPAACWMGRDCSCGGVAKRYKLSSQEKDCSAECEAATERWPSDRRPA